jgi:hypothetical protein
LFSPFKREEEDSFLLFCSLFFVCKQGVWVFWFTSTGQAAERDSEKITTKGETAKE